ncbi:MAG: hypothetical protein [Bacteriophage sp.]|nr:MAG: hypothetical protein [Bacteriophage sp.]
MATTGKGLPRSLKDASLGFDQVSGKPITYPPTVGTTATTAMAGNKVPTATQRGGVLLQAAQADSDAAPTQAEFNALLAKLRAAGILTAS